MGDFASAYHCKCRSLAELQALVLAGKFGSSVGILKPFVGLKVGEVREELHVRGILDTGKPKKELDEVLATTLKVAQHVRTLLITNPNRALRV